MPIAKNHLVAVFGTSLIRKMFNEGTRLKAEHGEENVFDFSLGNPIVPPPQEFTDAVIRIMKADIPGKHAYMTNSGYPETREFVARFLTEEQSVKVHMENIVMTCGAGAALTLLFQAILNVGDNVVVSIPNFVVYKTYVENFGGVLRTVPCQENFFLDLDAMEKAIDGNTAAVLINSPNNPCGVIYPQEQIDGLAALLEKKSREFNRAIYLVSDEPYRQIVFDGYKVPAIFPSYKHSIIVSSYSKSLSIPGERIGWTAVHPEADEGDLIIKVMTTATTGLGFTNAPALMQRALVEVNGKTVDPEIYRHKRDLLAEPLKEMGYDFILPHGTFYIFIKAPGGDDMKFVDTLQNELILAVPGSGFNMPGYFRLSCCVEDDMIIRSLPGFKKAIEKTLKKN
ncbi:MAG: pyridoxal phosphate-dependent aminotransferase [Spirochaetales bacterium]|nr:pyridoxal phosphate-dependent aminotransferase [Spirochaetales bacterium]